MSGDSGAITRSAPKRADRDTLDGGRPAVRFVFIDLDEVIAERLKDRKGHDRVEAALHNQFEDLSKNGTDEVHAQSHGQSPGLRTGCAAAPAAKPFVFKAPGDGSPRRGR